MQILVVAAIALIGAMVQGSVRHRESGASTAVDTFLVWWLAVAAGAGSVLGAAAHLFDGPATAEMIGYTRGNGGFQFENAMGDLSIGIAGLLCVRFRGDFWLAVIVVLSVQFYGDGAGHLYYRLAENNTEPGNVGPPLWLDFIIPTVAWGLYCASRRRNGDAVPPAGRWTSRRSG